MRDQASRASRPIRADPTRLMSMISASSSLSADAQRATRRTRPWKSRPGKRSEDSFWADRVTGAMEQVRSRRDVAPDDGSVWARLRCLGTGAAEVGRAVAAARRAVLLHLSPRVAAMIQVQHLGARPQEVASVRPCEVDTGEGVRLYRPRGHKTEHLDRPKVIMHGPGARAVLRPRVDRDPGWLCLVPAETSAWKGRLIRRGAPVEVDVGDGGPRVLGLRPGLKSIRHSDWVVV